MRYRFGPEVDSPRGLLNHNAVCIAVVVAVGGIDPLKQVAILIIGVGRDQVVDDPVTIAVYFNDRDSMRPSGLYVYTVFVVSENEPPLSKPVTT